MASTDDVASMILQQVDKILYGQAHQNALVADVAVEDQPLEIQALVQEISLKVNDATFGLAAIQSQLAALAASTSSALADIQAAIVALGTPQQSGSPVTLPTTPPAGYGGAAASDVWNYNVGSGNVVYASAALYQAAIGGWTGAGYLDSSGLSNIFAITNFGTIQDGPSLTIQYPTFVTDGIASDASLLASLQRQNPTWTCVQGYGANGPVTMIPPSPGVVWVTIINEAMFDQLQYFLYTPASGLPMRSTLGDTAMIFSLIPIVYPP